MNAIMQPLIELDSFGEIIESIKSDKRCILTEGVLDTQKVHLIYGALKKLDRNGIIITSSELKAKEIIDDLKYFIKDNIVLYPSKDIIFYSADVHSMDIIDERIKVFRSIIEKQPKIIVLSIEALLDRLVPRKIFKEYIIKRNVGEILDLEKLIEQLVFMGYERVDLVESKGQFSVRGGIIDIYPMADYNAYRIELWDDEIDSIRIMEPQSQRSIEKVESIEIYPAVELVIKEEQIEEAVNSINNEIQFLIEKFDANEQDEEKDRIKEIGNKIISQLTEEKIFKGLESYITYFYKETATLLDYISDDTLMFVDEPMRVSDKCSNTFFEFQDSIKGRLEKGYLLKSQANMIYSDQDIMYQLNKRKGVLLNTLSQNTKGFLYDDKIEFYVKSINPFHQKFDILEKEIKAWLKDNYRIVLLAGSKTRAERLVQELTEREIRAVYSKDLSNPVASGEVVISYGSIHRGFEYPQIKFAILSEAEVFGKSHKIKKRKKKPKGRKINSFADLNVGDYVVHENHGVGIYRGMEQIEVEGINKDYLKISYKDGGNLYIPTNQFDMLQKYIGTEGRRPKLNKLGGTEWQKAKMKVKKAVADLAQDLVKLYATRQSQKGFVYSTDTVWQKEFEEMFPYDETDDQLLAIEEVKRDMETNKIMDRLLCGDVGYGKTEVAIRAAFKAVQDGKQVAYLVPTTILAQQHYNNFTERMKDFPINVELLSRFRTAKEQKLVLENAKKGFVDIIIGTHRLFSKDVKYKNLGLLIIDEEQRFGVVHKEKIKKLKENIDVLALTATPIPRTLHMSLIGIRDMSLLEEPPQERHPVQTYVLEENNELIKDAIYRELSRGGQIYYVYNKVKDIDIVTEKVKQLAPEAVVAYAHGQMSERQLEEIMLEFVNGQIDILVCTTIIETGLDIQNTNTMIIQDADHMGLSQLYQLRGRVGRSNRIAYAYLLYKKNKVLQQSAEKRLQAIKEFTEFGSGFKIAMRDLEIRGAGNILGPQQHGHMEAVGYDMYCKLLEEAVREVKQEPIKEIFETTVNLDVDGFIPKSYINNEMQKLEIYKKIASIDNIHDYYDIQEELEDRYGDLPISVNNLLDISLIKAEANKAQILLVEQKGPKIVFEYKENAKVDSNKIPDLMKKYRNKLFISSNKDKTMFTYKIDQQQNLITNIKNIIQELINLKLD